MFHALIFLLLKTNEIHDINFVNKMNEINTKQDSFQITIRQFSFSEEKIEISR